MFCFIVCAHSLVCRCLGFSCDMWFHLFIYVCGNLDSFLILVCPPLLSDFLFNKGLPLPDVAFFVPARPHSLGCDSPPLQGNPSCCLISLPFPFQRNARSWVIVSPSWAGGSRRFRGLYWKQAHWPYFIRWFIGSECSKFTRPGLAHTGLDGAVGWQRHTHGQLQLNVCLCPCPDNNLAQTFWHSGPRQQKRQKWRFDIL